MGKILSAPRACHWDEEIDGQPLKSSVNLGAAIVLSFACLLVPLSTVSTGKKEMSLCNISWGAISVQFEINFDITTYLALQVSSRIDMFRNNVDFLSPRAKSDIFSLLAYVGQGFPCAHSLASEYVDLDIHIYCVLMTYILHFQQKYEIQCLWHKICFGR